MKICFIAHLRDLSGANRSLIDLATIFNTTDDITVVVPHKGELQKRLNELKIKNKVIYSGTWVSAVNEKKIKQTFKKFVNKIAEIRFYFYFKKNKFDIVHFNSSTYGCGAKSLNILKMDYTWHMRELAEKTFNLHFFNRTKSYKLINNSKKIIAISDFVKKEIEEDINKSNIEVIYNGIQLDVSKNKDYDGCLENLLLVGAINKDKGQLEALKALNWLITKESVNNISLTLVGEIINKEYYQILITYIKEHNLNSRVIFTGYISNIYQYRSSKYIALLCSENEAFGRVIIEAMLNSQLFIGSNTGATQEIVTNNLDGFIYEYGNYIDLAEKIKKVISLSEKERKVITTRAYEKVINNFCISITANKLKIIFESIKNIHII